jgi:hypothetical protein
LNDDSADGIAANAQLQTIWLELAREGIEFETMSWNVPGYVATLNQPQYDDIGFRGMPGFNYHTAMRALVGFPDLTPLEQPVWWMVGESHLQRTTFADELWACQAATPGFGSGTTFGQGIAWSTPNEPWTRNSGYSGTSFTEEAAIIDGTGSGPPQNIPGESPTVSTTDNVTHLLIFEGTNSYNPDLSIPAAGLTAEMIFMENAAPLAVAAGHKWCISPLLSTSPAHEANIALLRPVVQSVCATRGWTYIDAMAGPYAIGPGDVSPDLIHLTAAGYTKVAKTVALAVGFVVP